jgi:hypothetical protein
MSSSSIHELLTVERLAAWLETQPAETKYDYFSCRGCLIARYLIANGAKSALVGGSRVGATLADGARVDIGLPKEVGDISQDGDHTYGAALERAKAAGRAS